MLNNNNHSHNPYKIGIFDSGLGGLMVAESLNQSLSGYDLLYGGDNAHCPWGDKPTNQITDYCLKLTKFLAEQHCSIIVVACNTASCVALEAIYQQFNQLRIFNVIDPVINYLAQLNLANITDIGIIGTKQTIGSNVYQQRISQLLPTNTHSANNINCIKALATPELVPLIESGSLDNDQSFNLLIERYLSVLDLQHNSILILGCTHYPLIKRHIVNYCERINRTVTIIDPNWLLTQQITVALQQLSNINSSRIANFYCTSHCEAFLQLTRQFFANITLDFLPLWK